MRVSGQRAVFAAGANVASRVGWEGCLEVACVYQRCHSDIQSQTNFRKVSAGHGAAAAAAGQSGAGF